MQLRRVGRVPVRLAVPVVVLDGMKSVMETTPVDVAKTVSRMLVSGRYDCSVAYVALGRMRNLPPISWSRIAAKTLGESKRGKQSQSTEPSVPTSAAEDMSPMSP